MLQPNLIMITAGFTDFSTLLTLALVLLREAGLRLDATGMGGEGSASRLHNILVWHNFKSTQL